MKYEEGAQSVIAADYRKGSRLLIGSLYAERKKMECFPSSRSMSYARGQKQSKKITSDLAEDKNSEPMLCKILLSPLSLLTQDT